MIDYDRLIDEASDSVLKRSYVQAIVLAFPRNYGVKLMGPLLVTLEDLTNLR